MVVLDVYTKTINITYKSTILSKATFVCFLSSILSIVLPYIFAYQSGGNNFNFAKFSYKYNVFSRILDKVGRFL